MNRISKRRLAENQVVFRKANEQLKTIITELNEIPPERGIVRDTFDKNETYQFFCECSNEKCRERIELTYEMYEKIHVRNDTFVIANGHEVSEIEEIVTATAHYLVVRKFETPSQTVDVLHTTSLGTT
jgi:hypothetical protein